MRQHQITRLNQQSAPVNHSWVLLRLDTKHFLCFLKEKVNVKKHLLDQGLPHQNVNGRQLYPQFCYLENRNHVSPESINVLKCLALYKYRIIWSRGQFSHQVYQSGSESHSVMSDSLRPHGLYSIVHGNLQARILEWVAFPFSRGSSQSRDQTQVSHIAGRFFTT